MKKWKTILSTIFTLLIIIACNNVINESETSTKNSLKIQKYDKIASLHTKSLQNAKDKFVYDSQSDYNNNDKIDVINQFNLNYLNDEIKLENFSVYEQASHKYKSFINHLEFDKKLNHLRLNREKSVNPPTFIDSLLLLNIINEEAYEIIDELLDLTLKNHGYEIDNVEYSNKINHLYDEFNANASNYNNVEKDILGTSLYLAKSSVDWWIENPGAIAKINYRGKKKAAPVLAMDAAGAMWGAASGAIGSYLASGEVSGVAVGSGAVMGAIGASTGVIGKIASWFS